jgi:hypothetical protein
MPITKRKGERKPDFINRCIGIEVAAGKRPSQAAAICYTTWEELSLKELKKKRTEQKLEDNKMITTFSSIKGEDFTKWGLSIEDLLNPKNQSGQVEEGELLKNFADIPEGYFVRYKYISNEYGPQGFSEKSRPFCVMMMTDNRNTWFSREDIEALNTAPGKANRKGNKPYSVFNWRGGNWCKHIWIRYYYNPDTNDFLETPVQPAQKSTNPR